MQKLKKCYKNLNKTSNNAKTKGYVMSDRINDIKENNEYIQRAVGYLNQAKGRLAKISEHIKNLGPDTDQENFYRTVFNLLEVTQSDLAYAREKIHRIWRCEEKTVLEKEYKRLHDTTKECIKKADKLVATSYISQLDSDNLNQDGFFLFGKIKKRDGKVAKQLAKKAEYDAEKAKQEAFIAEQKAKETQALREVRKLEADIAAEKSKKEGMELLNVLRDKEERIVKNARETIEIARQAMADAIKAEDIRKAKEQAELIKSTASKITDIAKTDFNHEMDKTHEMFNSVLKDIQQNISPMLVGPAGSGKSTVLQQIADALSLKYYPLSVNGQTSEYQIIGFKNANGEYIRSAFRDAFENGGLFSFEEIDAGNPNVLTVMNNALSQDFYLFPDGYVSKHANFRLAASANTYGRGANRQYIGRNPLDAATLDRFAMSYVDYDEDLERQIGPEPKWTDYIQTIRHVVDSFGIPLVVSTRAIVFGGRDVKSGTDWDVALEKFVWRGCKQEDVQKIMHEVNALYAKQKKR